MILHLYRNAVVLYHLRDLQKEFKYEARRSAFAHAARFNSHG
jgi:hypothetical protein